MNARWMHILAAVAALSLTMMGETAHAQTAEKYHSLGTFHSPKGFGMSITKQSKAEYFTDFELIADMTDIWMGNRSSVGVKGTYTHNMLIGRGVTVDRNVLAEFYAGPGLTAGYARDTGKDYGIIAGLSGVTGCRLTFESGAQIALDFGLDIALFAAHNSRYNNLELALYKEGLTHFPFPQIKITYIIKHK